MKNHLAKQIRLILLLNLVVSSSSQTVLIKKKSSGQKISKQKANTLSGDNRRRKTIRDVEHDFKVTEEHQGRHYNRDNHSFTKVENYEREADPSLKNRNSSPKNSAAGNRDSSIDTNQINANKKEDRLSHLYDINEKNLKTRSHDAENYAQDDSYTLLKKGKTNKTAKKKKDEPKYDIPVSIILPDNLPQNDLPQGDSIGGVDLNDLTSPTSSISAPSFSIAPTLSPPPTLDPDATKVTTAPEPVQNKDETPSDICVTGVDLGQNLGNCLEGHNGLGCTDNTCQDTICIEIEDDFCCTGEWDHVCAQEAKLYCIIDSLPESNCYLYSEYEAGCDSTECQNKVCSLDISCCDTAWSIDCVLHSVDVCCLTDL